MKNISTILLMLLSTYSLSFAQLSPAITSWKLNRTGATGYNNLPADVQRVRYSSSFAYPTASGIPSFTIGPWRANPNTAGNQNKTYKIPLQPQVQNGNKTATGLGRIAVATNGVAIYNAKDAFSYQNANTWFQNAVVVEAVSFDACLGHPEMSSTYHFHQSPKCGYTFTPTSHSPIVGYAFDGYPIYGPYAYTATNGTGAIKRMVSSYRLRNITTRRTLPNGTQLAANLYGPDVSTQYPLGYYLEDYEYVQGLGDLDQYNGRFAVTPEYPQGTYAYYCTIDASGNSAYPYIIGPQYYGVVETSNTGMGVVNVTESVIEYTGLSTSTPTFTATPTSIAFGTINLGTPSTRSYIIQGASFTNPLVITAPTGFSLSTAENGTFTQTLTITPVNNSIANTTIFVRFAPTQAGLFSNTITQITGTTALTPITVSGTAITPSSVRTYSDGRFIVFPSPAEHTITIEANVLRAGEAMIFVTDILGKRIMTESVMLSANGSTRIPLNISQMLAGAYFVEIQQATTRYTVPFIKM